MLAHERLKHGLASRAERYNALVTVVNALVILRRVEPDGATGVQIDRPNGKQFAAPSTGQLL